MFWGYATSVAPFECGNRNRQRWWNATSSVARFLHRTRCAVDEALAAAVGDLAAAKSAKPLTTSALAPEYRRERLRVFTKRAVLAAALN